MLIDCESKMIMFSELKDEYGELLMLKCDLEYDILVLVIGLMFNDFNILGVKEYCIFLDSLE